MCILPSDIHFFENRFELTHVDSTRLVVVKSVENSAQALGRGALFEEPTAHDAADLAPAVIIVAAARLPRLTLNVLDKVIYPKLRRHQILFGQVLRQASTEHQVGAQRARGSAAACG